MEERFAEAAACEHLGKVLIDQRKYVEARVAVKNALRLYQAMGLANNIERVERDLRSLDDDLGTQSR